MSHLPRKPKQKKNIKALMLGIATDSDGHKRVTTGPSFAVVGGTAESHEVLTEKLVKINEKIGARGKRIEDVSRQEFEEIADSVGLKRPES